MCKEEKKTKPGMFGTGFIGHIDEMKKKKTKPVFPVTWEDELEGEVEMKKGKGDN